MSIVASGGTAITAGDRKSTRLNSSHMSISYAVFCLKKKKIDEEPEQSQLRPRQTQPTILMTSVHAHLGDMVPLPGNEVNMGPFLVRGFREDFHWVSQRTHPPMSCHGSTN